jgi:hypothetical protein
MKKTVDKIPFYRLGWNKTIYLKKLKNEKRVKTKLHFSMQCRKLISNDKMMI